MFPDNWFNRLFSDFPPYFDRMFERMLRDHPETLYRPHPPVNVREDEECIEVLAALPGYQPDSLDVRVEGDVLVLEGERTPPAVAGGRLTRQERWYGKFRREIALPAKVAADGVEASYDDGLLTLTLPKAPAAKPQVIKVAVK